MRLGSLFSGYGGLDMAAADVFGARPMWFVDNEPSAAAVLAHHYPHVPNLGDVTAVDWPNVERVDVLTGGFPCQDVSSAGKRAGMRPDTRSGLWAHMARAIAVLRPRVVVAENVRGLLSAAADSDVEPCPWCLGDGDDEPHVRALGAVLGDLAELGYDAAWHGLRAADVGAPHNRFRVFVVAVARDAYGMVGGQASARGRRPGAGGQPEQVDGAVGPDRAPVADADGEPPGPLRSDSPRQVSQPDVRRPVLSSNAAADAHVEYARAVATGDRRGEPEAPARDGGRVAADPAGHGRHQGRSEPARQLGRHDAAECGRTAADADSDGRGIVQRVEPSVGTRHDVDGRGPRDWGEYGPAIDRWEHLIGRPAPAPTETGARGGAVLAPRFVEWLMGLPAGHVTDVPGLTRTEQLRLLGNGVVPQQAAAALAHLAAVIA